MDMENQVRQLLADNGLADFGFACLPDGPAGLTYALSLVVPLSDAILDEIDLAPTPAYYHHYRTSNAYIDRVLLQVGLLLQRRGWRYLPVAASQSMPSSGTRSHQGLYSHKKAAASAGLGTIGKSTLFLHHKYGARVRLGTLFTDCPLSETRIIPRSACADCDLCVRACPAGAIKGVAWQAESQRSDLLDVEACHAYKRKNFMQIGRGAVCGICVRVCPYNRKRTPAAGPAHEKKTD